MTLTPTSKLVQSIMQLPPESVSAPRNLIVLLTTGAFCPIHLGHTAMLQAAKDFIEAADKRNIVLGAYISPTHDYYTEHKLGNLNACVEDRLHMCRVATKDIPWIDVDLWEASQSDFVDFPEVADRLKGFLNDSDAVQGALRTKVGEEATRLQKKQQSLESPIRVVYVCGFDLAMRCSLRSLQRSDCGIAVVLRDSPTPDLVAALRARMFRLEWKGSCFVVPAAETDKYVSSTSVRNARREGSGEVWRMCHPGVVRYIIEKRLWDPMLP